MDRLIWSKLPSELIRKIVLLSTPSIDTRLYFNLPSQKLDEERVRRLGWRLFCCNDGIFYNPESKSLHVLRIPRCHVIHRPIEMDSMDEWFSVFNQVGRAHNIETHTPHGNYVKSSSEPFYTEFRVLLMSDWPGPRT